MEALWKFVKFCEIEVPYWGDFKGQEHRWEEYNRLLYAANLALAAIPFSPPPAQGLDELREAADILSESLLPYGTQGRYYTDPDPVYDLRRALRDVPAQPRDAVRDPWTNDAILAFLASDEARSELARADWAVMSENLADAPIPHEDWGNASDALQEEYREYAGRVLAAWQRIRQEKG